MSLSRSSHAAVALVCALALASCGTDSSPGVRTEKAQADIVFGVASPEEAELVSLEPPVSAETGDTGSGGPVNANPPLNVPFRNRIPDRFKNVPFTVDADTPSCPSAPLGAAPPEVAPRNASEPPASGLYRYKISGTRTMTVNGQEIESDVRGFEPRIVQAVERVSDTAWTFEMIQPNGDGTRITTYSVATAATQQSVNPPYVAENPVRAGEPGRGVAVELVEDFDSSGNSEGSFDPTTSLLVMPLPALPGESFQAAAADNRGQFMQIDGEVLDRKTVDACGDLVDGWLVTHEVSDVRSLESTTRTEEYIFATSMGGLPVSQRLVGEAVDAANGIRMQYDLTYTLGQIEPSALPEEVQQ